MIDFKVPRDAVTGFFPMIMPHTKEIQERTRFRTTYFVRSMELVKLE